MLNGHAINSTIFSQKSGNQRGRPKANSLKRNTNFAIASFSFEPSFSFITLSYLQYNKIPAFMTEEMGFFDHQNSAAKALVFGFFFFLESICSHRLKGGRKGEGLTLCKEGQKHNLQVRQEEQLYLLAQSRLPAGEFTSNMKTTSTRCQAMQPEAKHLWAQCKTLYSLYYPYFMLNS